MPRKLPSGLWQAEVRLPNGRRVTKTDPLKRVVVEWAHAERLRIRRGEFRDPKLGRTTYDEWRDRWWRNRVVEDETRRRNQGSLRNHVNPAWSGWQLAQIGRMDVQGWVRRMEEAGTGRHAIKAAYTLFAKMLADAVLEGLIASTPCRRIELPATPPKPPAWFTRNEINTVEAHLPESHAVMVELMVMTGLRWGEAAGLRGTAVDWLRGRARVLGVLTQQGAWKPYPKSSKSRREVPVPAYLLDRMGALLTGRQPGGYVFVTTRGGLPLRGANWRKRWNRALDRAAGVRRLTPHDCRHTCASWLVQAGVPLYEVGELLGHESPATTRCYAHLAKGAFARIEDAWRNVMPHERRTDTSHDVGNGL